MSQQTYKDLLQSADVAKLLGCTPFSVRRLAAKHGIGVDLGGRWVFFPPDIERLRAVLQPVGNPNRKPDKDLGRPAKKSGKSRKSSR